MREVEILKIGSIIPSFVGKKEQKKTIMIVRNGGPIFDYYVNKLKSCDEYNYLKSDQSIVGYSNPFIHFKANKKLNLIGVPDGDPIVGKTYGINGNWYTSPIIKIIDNCVLITENSIYAIHHISKIREDKLKQLGI
jgi:hypothetical protein